MAKIPDSADRPAKEPTEIEVTPAMIESGAEILLAEPGVCEALSPLIARVISERILVSALLGRNHDRIHAGL
jgi:hypothetical protein